MKKTIKTQHDGWECEPKLQEAAHYINELAASVYEIEHCVRHSNIKDLVEGMLLDLHDATRILETIDTDVEYVTSKGQDNDFCPDEEAERRHWNAAATHAERFNY